LKTIVEILENHFKAPRRWSSFPLVSGKLFSVILNHSVYSVSRANKMNFPAKPHTAQLAIEDEANMFSSQEIIIFANLVFLLV
jgi:hypothetical protein